MYGPLILDQMIGDTLNNNIEGVIIKCLSTINNHVCKGLLTIYPSAGGSGGLVEPPWMFLASVTSYNYKEHYRPIYLSNLI